MKQFLKEWGLFSFILIVILLSRLFIWNLVSVEGHSMDPTLRHKDVLVMLKIGSIDRFDIVVATETDENGKEKQIVKRLIGLPGDTIHYENDTLYINGQEVKEDYLEEYKAAFAQDKLQATYSYNQAFQAIAQEAAAFTLDAQGNPTFTIEIPEDQYYLLGDDRLVSLDSRRVGSFRKSAIKGKIISRLYPFNRIQGF
ncbi:signal peptidase I [Streptococcus azizii]|uniref:Signal peptidase I n=1 Tax=Streptococcus azizii TaxID=1579424 RepID=A0AB36JQN5_9STRE|nr:MULTISPECIES: signal peptidase I [Streptococcus]MBF0775652.1 signal peptidase I [Streptococcus sp. 19428wD3_AN2]ONK28566.1 signal peptidase I [Streptococcus azizii]ONK29261.1 signal peptidase I [Streptococcus azizii]ONK30251.1 signal peptidase I [Streptococcus azizii]TFU84199.1 signal peptidase I [Streptococcus sp. AN2]